MPQGRMMWLAHAVRLDSARVSALQDGRRDTQLAVSCLDARVSPNAKERCGFRSVAAVANLDLESRQPRSSMWSRRRSDGCAADQRDELLRGASYSTVDCTAPIARDRKLADYLRPDPLTERGKKGNLRRSYGILA